MSSVKGPDWLGHSMGATVSARCSLKGTAELKVGVNAGDKLVITLGWEGLF